MGKWNLNNKLFIFMSKREVTVNKYSPFYQMDGGERINGFIHSTMKEMIS